MKGFFEINVGVSVSCSLHSTRNKDYDSSDKKLQAIILKKSDETKRETWKPEAQYWLYTKMIELDCISAASKTNVWYFTMVSELN